VASMGHPGANCGPSRHLLAFPKGRQNERGGGENWAKDWEQKRGQRRAAPVVRVAVRWPRV